VSNTILAGFCQTCMATVETAIDDGAAIGSTTCAMCGAKVYVSRYVRLDIGLSEVCNLSCNMCRRPQEKAFMGPELIDRVLRDAKSIGVRTISFSGGEPFVHPHFREALRLAVELGFEVQLVTNGTLVRADDIALLENAGCVTVSIDGPEPEHDFIRGHAGSWARSAATLRLLAGSKATWGVNTVIQSHNAEVLLDTWRAVRACGRPSYFGFTHVEVVPETAHLSPSQAQWASIKTQIEAVGAACAADGIYFNDAVIVTDLYDAFANKERRYRPTGGCSIPERFVGVSNYGFFPCWHQGRAIAAAGLIEALETELCKEIIAEARARRCVGCNAANYTWDEQWVQGIAAAAKTGEWNEGVLYLSQDERQNGALSSGKRTLPILERRSRREY